MILDTGTSIRGLTASGMTLLQTIRMSMKTMVAHGTPTDSLGVIRGLALSYQAKNGKSGMMASLYDILS